MRVDLDCTRPPPMHASRCFDILPLPHPLLVQLVPCLSRFRSLEPRQGHGSPLEPPQAHQKSDARMSLSPSVPSPFFGLPSPNPASTRPPPYIPPSLSLPPSLHTPLSITLPFPISPPLYHSPPPYIPPCLSLSPPL